MCIIRGFALCCAQARWDERGKLQNALPAMLGSVLGSKALQIEHVGSTSVPGLCAKPIIDILLVVKNSADEPSYVPTLEAADYILRIREPEWFEHRMFKGPDTDINLHVFSEGTSEINRMLQFRDWLRSNDADRDKYHKSNKTWQQINGGMFSTMRTPKPPL